MRNVKLNYGNLTVKATSISDSDRELQREKMEKIIKRFYARSQKELEYKLSAAFHVNFGVAVQPTNRAALLLSTTS